MATKTKTKNQFADMVKDSPTKNHKTRQNASNQQKNAEIMETSSNSQFIAQGAKLDPKETEKTAENSAEKNEKKTAENSADSLKDFATKFYGENIDAIHFEFCLQSLQKAMAQYYSAYWYPMFEQFMYHTQNCTRTFVNSCDEKTEKDPTTKAIFFENKNTGEQSKLYKIAIDIPTTVAAMVARFNAFKTFAQKSGLKCYRDIQSYEKRNNEKNKQQKAIDNMSDDMLLEIVAKRKGMTLVELKKLMGI